HVDILRDLNTYRNPKAWWRILFHGPGLTLDKEKHYGFYRQSAGGAAAGAERGSSSQVEENTPNNVVV
ncbi:MAG: sterol desaturase family protein, partial [Bacteroidota bacterium]